MNNACQLCGQCTIAEVDDRRSIIYKGATEHIICRGTICVKCGGEYATAEQVQFNKQQMIEMKSQRDHQYRSKWNRIKCLFGKHKWFDDLMYLLPRKTCACCGKSKVRVPSGNWYYTDENK